MPARLQLSPNKSCRFGEVVLLRPSFIQGQGYFFAMAMRRWSLELLGPGQDISLFHPIWCHGQGAEQRGCHFPEGRHKQQWGNDGPDRRVCLPTFKQRLHSHQKGEKLLFKWVNYAHTLFSTGRGKVCSSSSKHGTDYSILTWFISSSKMCISGWQNFLMALIYTGQ